jgi:hypothetical protein
MATESELLADLRGPFHSLATAVIRESPDSPVRVEAVQLLLDAQDAAGRAARWSPPPPAAPLPDDFDRAQRRAQSEMPRRFR